MQVNKLINSIAPELIGLEQTLSDFWQKISRGSSADTMRFFRKPEKFFPNAIDIIVFLFFTELTISLISILYRKASRNFFLLL